MIQSVVSKELKRRAVWLGLCAVLMLLPTMGPQCNEEEPNDSVGSANLLRNGEYGVGDISPAGNVDVRRHDRVNAGDLIFAFADAQASSASTGSFLIVLANDGTTMIASDDHSGPGASAAVAGAAALQDGSVFFHLSETGNDSTISSYVLHQAVLNPAAASAEKEPNDTPLTADVIRSRIVTADVVNGDVDFFKFRASQGAKVAVIMDDSPDGGTNTDTDLDILDTDGTSSLATGDNNGPSKANAAGTLTIGTTGTYFVRVSNGTLVGSDSDYRFVLLVNGVAYSDFDEDGVANPDDNCSSESNPGQEDSDGDGFGDACDNCPTSVLKQTPGACGCNQPDVDIDGDGVEDCGVADPARALLPRRGVLLAVDVTNHRVMAFDPADGKLVDANFVPSDAVHLPNPVAAILGPDQNSILVSDASAQLVQRYDFDGNFLGSFAPAGGANLSVMQSPAGMTLRPNGHLLVCVQVGANANSVAEFDAAGNFVGNFIAPAAGGLASPFDVQFRKSGNVLVSGLGQVLEYNGSGGFIGLFATADQFPVQVIETADNQIIATGHSGRLRGFDEFSAAGAFVAQRSPASLSGFTGIAELGDGKLLVATENRVGTGGTDGLLSGGVFRIQRDGNDATARISGMQMRFIELARQDADGDGVGDAVDNCPNAANGDQANADGDVAGDACDECINDPAKTSAGACGCGVADTDTDTDGTADCVDECPENPNLIAPQGCGGCGGACGMGMAVNTPLTLLAMGWRKARRRGCG